jgi:hypothetical protein
VRKVVPLAACIVVLCTIDGVRALAVQPAHYEDRTTVTIRGKDRSYYYGTEATPVEFHVFGPTRVRVIARVELGRRGAPRPFTVNVSVDDEKPRQHRLRAGRSPEAGFRGRSGVPVSESRSVYLDLAQGTHCCRVWGEAPQGRVWLRPLTALETMPVRRVSYSPRDWAVAVTLIAREGEYKYFRATAAHPVELEITGPTTVEVRSRMEFDFATKGVQNYRVRVIEDGEFRQTYAFSSRRSHVCVYRDLRHLVPGRANKFHLTVDRGRHVFVFMPQPMPDPTIGVLLKFLVPVADLRP